MIPAELSPTALLLTEMGDTPRAPLTAANDTDCAMCGMHLPAGSAVAAFRPGSTFNDHNRLADPGSAHLCGWCNAAWSRQYMQKTMRAIAIRGQGVFDIGKNLSLAYWLFHPPQADWVAGVATTTNQQHLWWGATVNAGATPVGQFQWGATRLFVRFAHFQQCYEACRAYRKHTGKPALIPDRDLSFELIGQTHTAKSVSVQTHDPSLYALLQRCTLGELWALQRSIWYERDEIEAIDLSALRLSLPSSSGVAA